MAGWPSGVWGPLDVHVLLTPPSKELLLCRNRETFTLDLSLSSLATPPVRALVVQAQKQRYSYVPNKRGALNKRGG